jgi:hypothetical protein
VTKTPLRRSNANGPSVSGQDWSAQGRDLAKAITSQPQLAKLSYSGYPVFPIALQVTQAPWALLAARVVPQNNVQAIAPQGGFCAFAYDAVAGTANVSACNAFITASGAPLLANVIYDFYFLAVF